MSCMNSVARHHQIQTTGPFFPTDNDLKNHIYMAKQALQFSCLDQGNVHLKIEQWKKTHPECTHLFRLYIQKGGIEESPSCSTTATPIRNKSSYVGNDAVDDTTAITDNCSYTQTLLWVHQTEWQKELLKRYGKSLIDANYKTTRYDLALFFICVRTNVGYSVIAEFVVQSKGSSKRSRCNCSGCQQSDDCVTCSICLDKTKLGGPGRKKQCCTRKKCMLDTQNSISV